MSAPRSISENAIGPFTLTQLREYVDNFTGSDRVKRRLASILLAEERRWEQLRRDEYYGRAEHFVKEAADVTRVAGQLQERAEEIAEVLESGQLDPKVGAAELAAITRDIRKLRAQAASARESESGAWSSAKQDSADYQAAVRRRFPVAFQGGRNQVVISESDLLGR